ncbi:FtsH protease activity modulator HflK [Rhodovulum sulfidophilum]|uniref:FtsH protease activity modulator HflK n=1 Tax=Paracoccaceae TaxID=31989 RepID=UPI0005A999CB|nr:MULTISPECIES: FtsH protease activity modulator HflK [Paracoccaceae]ANB35712.1 HflK protein [Rhodovulum sulfidophilum DSM 1374]ANB39534.1 HflK protein [Rhodovulum sulfidophilum]AZB68897.1 FtsH protease activity modulator HflK [Cereibacter sphaeroides]MBK5924633.1 HflK protein [Rhodovulum sulfidophilum]MBL3551400.1 FtsH protease activity modulator HflK [Rhodovulum sulfidophilum]
MAGNSGGPWGSGGSGQGGGGNRGGGGGRGPGDEPPQIPEIDELMRRGQEQLRVLMGGRGGRGGGPKFTRTGVALAVLAAGVAWAWASFYTVKPEEQSVELFLGRYLDTGNPGLNFAPWPLVSAEVIPVTREQTENMGVGRAGVDAGLMLTGDENIVDVDFQVVWNINDPAKFLFNLRDPRQTIRAVSESAMREIIAQSELAPILNRDRGLIASRLTDLIQQTLNSYDSGMNVVRVNFDKADPPKEVIDSFREVQAAEQERDRLEKQADAYANRVVAGARGEAAQILEEAEGYRARVVNEAEGEASRFSAVLDEYTKAPEVTRKRLYLETMEEVLGKVDMIMLDKDLTGTGGVVPYLPLNDLRRSEAGGRN